MGREESPTRILIVDDNPGDARLVEILLTEAGARLVPSFAASLREALEKLRGARFDAVLLDMALPDGRGLPALEAIQAEADGVAVLVLTGDEDEELARKALRAGAQDFIIKGAEGPVLKRALDHAVERVRGHEAMHQSERRFQVIFQNAPVGIAVTDPSGVVVECNRTLEEFLRIGPGATRGKKIFDFIHPEDAALGKSLRTELRSGKRDVFQMELRYRRSDGTPVWGRLTVSASRDRDGRLMFAIGIIEDIHERKELEDRLRLSGTVIDAVGEGVFVTDADWNVRFVNPAYSEISGFTPDEVVGKVSSLVSGGDMDAQAVARMNEALAASGKWTGEVWSRRKSGEVYAEWLSVTAVREPNGRIRDHVGIISDVTSRKLDQERMAWHANHDPLTGLPNRMLFRERLSRALARAQRTQREVALFFLDLDRFKEINDTLGHHVGDLLLKEVSSRLGSGMRQGDTLARLAGDEFTIILEDLLDFRDAAVVAQKVLRQCGEPFELDGHRVRISSSIGIALYPSDGQDVDALLQAADAAMYRAKKHGKNNYQFHAEQLNARSFERQALESSLRHALAERQFEIYYQPVVEIASLRIIGAECLLRWHHPQYGLVLPGQFLPMAESMGLDGEIAGFAIDEACTQAGAWIKAGHQLVVSLNLARHQLRNWPIEERAIGAMRAAGLPPGALEIEIPEAALSDLRGDLGSALKRMREAGVRIAIDDFGAGYSTFKNLKRLPVDTVKIDSTYVRDIMVDAEDARIVSAIATAARSLDLMVVAKGVETREQMAFLRGSACVAGQGFLFGAPMPADRFADMLAVGTAYKGRA